MFNTDKAGLDQGFSLPTSEETFRIPYYENGYISRQEYDEAEQVFKTIVEGNGTE